MTAIGRQCVVCEKPIRRGSYRWIVEWRRDKAPSPRAFEVQVCNEPSCVAGLARRLGDYSWESGMARVTESSGLVWDYEVEEIG